MLTTTVALPRMVLLLLLLRCWDLVTITIAITITNVAVLMLLIYCRGVEQPSGSSSPFISIVIHQLRKPLCTVFFPKGVEGNFFFFFSSAAHGMFLTRRELEDVAGLFSYSLLVVPYLIFPKRAERQPCERTNAETQTN